MEKYSRIGEKVTQPQISIHYIKGARADECLIPFDHTREKHILALLCGKMTYVCAASPRAGGCYMGAGLCQYKSCHL